MSDKPKKFWKKYGKRYPFVILGGLPAILTLAAIFSPPYLDPISGAWIYFAWILITTCTYEFFFTLISLNHFAQYPEKYREDRARRKVGAIRMALSLVGTVIGYVIPPFFIEYGDPSSYMRMAWIFAFFSLIIFGSTIPGHRESKELKLKYVKDQASEYKLSFWKALKLSLTLKNFMAVVLIFLLDSIIGASLTASIQYVTKYILESSPESSTLILAGFILVALLSLWPWLILSNKLENNRKMLIIGVFLNTIFLLPFMFAQTLIGMTISAIFLGIGGGALRIGRNPVMADAIDEATVKYGQHFEGVLMGVYTFFNRFSLIGQGLIFAIVHQFTGFNPYATHQTELAKFGIRMHTSLIPMILTLIGLIIFILVYNLTPERTKEIKEKLKELNL